MKRVLAKDLKENAGKEVTLCGWLHALRDLGKISFLILRDHSGFSQVVIADKAMQQTLRSLSVGSVLSVQGKASLQPQLDAGVEVVDPKVEVVSSIKEAPPIEYYKPEIPSDLEFILDHRSLALRNSKIQAVFRIQAEIVHAYRLYMHDQVGAHEYFGPNLIGASSEGGAEFFNVDYFGYSATLAQSSQLYKQVMVGVNEKAFALMPFFRAEPSHTPRHLTEGKQFEFEMALWGNWEEVMDVQEGCLRFVLSYLEKQAKKELDILGWDPIRCPTAPFPRLTFAEAQNLYFERTGVDDRQEPDLSPAAEKSLCQWARETHGSDFLFVTHWKREKRPFYSFPDPKNPHLTETFDLLCRGTEITSGGKRRHTHDAMVEGIVEKGMDPKNFEDYLAIFRYGMPPHGGFGMGMERLTMTLLDLKNIREASLFPSDPKRIAGNRIRAKLFFGGENIRNEIIRLLKHQGIPFEHRVHEATPTSEDSARVRGTKLEEGVKAIILRGKQSKKNFQLNLPSHLKLDMKAVSDLVGEKCEFEEPAIILERFGLVIGGVPPFGNLLNLDTYFDQRILNGEKVAFNCGLQTESIVMPAQDLVTLTQGKVAAFGKE
jgi:nondiscriminating aspartyl-tRNA synthetase